MSEIKWIKIVIDIFDDEKIKLIETMPEGDTILVIWLKLLCKAGKNNALGEIFLKAGMPYSDEMLATVLGKPLNIVRLALKTFEAFGMVEITERETLLISNWARYQNIEGMQRVRELTRKRVERCRDKKKIESNVTKRYSNDIELDIELDNISIGKNNFFPIAPPKGFLPNYEKTEFINIFCKSDYNFKIDAKLESSKIYSEIKTLFPYISMIEAARRFTVADMSSKGNKKAYLRAICSNLDKDRVKQDNEKPLYHKKFDYAAN